MKGCVTTMKGCVTTKHLLSCAHTIIAEFGLRVYLRAVYCSLRHPRHSTFLECLHAFDARYGDQGEADYNHQPPSDLTSYGGASNAKLGSSRF